MKNHIFRRTAAAVLSLVIALSVCGCGGRGGRGDSRRDEDPEQTEAVEEAGETLAAQASTRSDGTFATDSVVLEHTANNHSLKLEEETPRAVNSFHLYVENTESMEGYVRKMSEYQIGMQGVIGNGYNLFDNFSAHYLQKDPSSGELQWTREEIENGVFRKVYTQEFYHGNVLPENGALAQLFRKHTVPFEENGVTVIVSNFLEQSFNMNVLAEGVKQYFDSFADSAVSVIGLGSRLEGRHYIPSETGSQITFFVDNFEGVVPFYILTVGPEEAVRTYTRACSDFLESKDIYSSKCIYTNTVYDQMKSDPLVFEVIPDRQEKKVEPPVTSSYNCGELTDNDEGNAFFSTFSSITTRASRGRKSETSAAGTADVGRSTQIALFSRNYDGEAQFQWNTHLYRFDEENSQWVDAGQSANDMVHFSCEPVNGKIVDEITGETLLTQGRQELYMTAVLDFSEDSAISRDHIYRLEVSTDLNSQNVHAVPDHMNSLLKNMSIDSGKYYEMISQLCILGNGNYVWTGTSPITTNPENKAAALQMLAHTPNLDVLLNGLEEVEDKYHPNEERIQYFDFLFNLPDKNSRR